MTGNLGLITGLAASMAWIVAGTAWLKWHPFIVLLLAALVGGCWMGVPLPALVGTLTGGFGQMMAHIGLVVILGTLIGVILDKTGATLVLARWLVQCVGRRHPQWAMALIGFLVGIPIFCDSGYVILSGLLPPLARQTGAGMGGLVAGLAGGLYITHTLLPPHPGAVAGAANLNIPLGPAMTVGLAVSLLPLAVLLWAAPRLSQLKIPLSGPASPDDASIATTALNNEPSTNAAMPLWRAIAPIATPLLLLGLGAVHPVMPPAFMPSALLAFVGQPVIALLAGLLACVVCLRPIQTRWIDDGIRQAGPILILVGAGGMFGAVIKASPLKSALGMGSEHYPLIGLLLIGWALGCLLKTAQGSTTAAIIVASSLLAPMVNDLNVWQRALLLSAISSGAMMISHANDAYFWIIREFSHLTTAQTGRIWSVLSVGLGLAGLAMACLLTLWL